MKKLLSIATAVLLIVSLSVPAFAHHGSRGGGSRTVSYYVCSIQSCTQTGLHNHWGRAYNAHYYGDGHNYHAYCGLEDCAISGYHSHDGVYCFGHTNNDGHDYHGYCNIAGCTQSGYHAHNGEHSFGHTAYDGHGYHYSSRGHH